MFRPAALFIGLRYTRAKRRNLFISFISLISMLGIALGVMVMITVLSVMNGFDREIKSRVFSMVAPITISSVSGYIANWPNLQKTIQTFPFVKTSAPFASKEVLISYGGNVQPAILNGILPEEEKKISVLHEKMLIGKLTDLRGDNSGIILGETLLNRLNAKVGDKITVVTPQVSLTPVGVLPWSKRFTIIGVFRAGSGFGFDAGLGFIHLQDAQKLMGLGDNVTGLHVTVDDVYKAQRYAFAMQQQLNAAASISTWADQFGEFFHAVQLEKTMMFFILLLIVGVAAFNLVSTLVMVVHEKQTDIAILRTYGATPAMIMKIFIVQGGLIGFFGTIMGVVGGLLLAFNVTELVNWIEHIFNVQFLSSSVYFVDYLPSEVQWPDVIKISLASFILSLFATIYPAWRAAKMDPVESLRYE